MTNANARSLAPLPDDPARYRRDREYLRSKVPPREVRLAGPVGAAVTIRWDTWGIPHIRARYRRDLFFGLGYATAQECLWRMDYARRLARGELAAVLGRDALPSDQLMRLLGIGADADRRAPDESESVAEALDALAAGVNHWIGIAVERRLLPVEFDWLGYEPAPWTPADSIACWKHRWWTLTGRLENVALAEAARRHLPPELLASFLSTELGEETILPDGRIDAALAGLPGAGSPGGAGGPGGADTGEGSNNWVVSGARTTTGYPVLCSDPHNPFTQPGQWFQVQLTLDDGSLDVAGAVYATTPGVYFGRNRRVAWGFTNHVAPVRDLYVETVDPVRTDHYREGSEWRPMEASVEQIAVRGEAPAAFEVRRTSRGPLINAFLPSLGGEEPPISLRWLGTEVASGFDALLSLNQAASAPAAAEAMGGWLLPIANLLVADTDGHVAYHAVGRVPRRAEAARRYRRAADPLDSWQGFLAYDELPHASQPPHGWIATANQPPWRQDPPGLSYLAGGAWADGGRMRRIRRRLEASARLDPQELAALQGDVTSERALELVPALLRLVQGEAAAGAATGAAPRRNEAALDDPAAERREASAGTSTVPATPAPATPAPATPATAAQAIGVLSAWDGRYTLDSAAPTIWTAFWDHWLRRVTAARFPAHLVSLAHSQAGAIARALLLGQDTAPSWLDGRSVAAEATATLEAAVDWLAARFGPALDAWQWGRVHTVTWSHALSQHGPPALRQAAREALDVGPFPTTGGPTVRAAGYAATRPYHVSGGATYRLVADLSPGGGLRAVTTTGNSGHPASPHYADQAALWLADTYHPLPMDDAPAEGTTTITPPA